MTLYGSHGQLFDESKKLEPKQLLLNYGAAHDSFSLAFLPTTGSEEVVFAEVVDYDEQILTNVGISTHSAGTVDSKKAVNITCEFSFEAKVGVTDYTIVVMTSEQDNATKSYKMNGQYTVAGMVLYAEDGSVVSGENAKGLSFESYEEVLSKGAKSLRGLSQNPSSSKACDMSKMKLSVKPMSSTSYSVILDESSLTMNKNFLYISPKAYRVSDTPQMVVVANPECEVDGESFETVLMVSVLNTVAPPPVVTGPAVVNMSVNSEGAFDMHFFNLMNPPQKKTIKSVDITAEHGGQTFRVASAEYKDVVHEPHGEVLRFKSLPMEDSGAYSLQLRATFEDGEHVSCHLENEIELRVAEGSVSGLSSSDDLSSASVKGKTSLGTISLIAVGAIAGAAAVLFVVFALVKYYRQKSSEIMESSFSKSGPSGVPGEYGNMGGEFVLRDGYARTVSGRSEINFDGTEEDPGMTRTRSGVSSALSSQYSF